MKKALPGIAVLVVVAIILALLLGDFLGTKPDRLGDNPFALEVDHYKLVAEEDIAYRETRPYGLGDAEVTDMHLLGERLLVSALEGIISVNTDGSEPVFMKLDRAVNCLVADSERIFAAHGSAISVYDHRGALMAEWDDLGERCVLTNLVLRGDELYAADAGNRQVLVFDLDGRQLRMIEGKQMEGDVHGFVVPSANFDLCIDPYGELWIVNPGKHTIENYSDDGSMRGYWGGTAMDEGGFLGCCNPARIAAMPDGAFVTGEKGIVRIKIHEPSGAFRCYVAPPGSFEEDGKAPEVCVDEGGIIYALDLDRKQIRVFEPK